MKKKEKLFPLIIGRKGGEHLNLLDEIKTTNIELTFKNLVDKGRNLEYVKRKNIDNVHNVIGQEKNETIKKILIAFKRDLFNNRTIDESILVGFKDLEDDFYLLKNIAEDINKEKKEFNFIFERELYLAINNLKEITEKQFFKNGILFSSEILYDQINKNDFKFISLNKKKSKLIISVLKYLTRSVTKTTPYSSFNNIFCLIKKRKSYVNDIDLNYSKFQVLNLFFYYLKIILLKNIVFKNSLKIYLNKTVKYGENADFFNYFYNVDNNESFKKIRNNPVLEFIKSKIETDDLTYNELFISLIEVTGDSKQNIKNHIDKLIKEGFLIIKYPVSPSNPFWIEELQYKIKDTPDFKLKEILIKLLDYVLSQINIIEQNTDVEFRKKVVKETYQELILFFDRHDEDSGFASKVNQRDLFFEDTISNIKINIHTDTIRKLNKNLKILYFTFNKVFSSKENIKKKLSSFIKDDTKINILDFYEHVYLQNLSDLDKNKNTNTGFNDIVAKTINAIKYSKLYDTVDILKFCNEVNLHTEVKQSFGVYLQSKNENFDKVIVNSFSKGRGANISRFLVSFPHSYSEKIKDFNTIGSKIICDIKDASINNVNAFNPLSNSTVSINEDLALNDNYNIICLKDIFVGFNKSKHLVLFNKENIEISLTVLSLENIKRRAKFTQFLDIFDPVDNSVFSTFFGALDYFYKNSKENILFIPRLVFGDQIILQRRKWLIKKSHLLNIINKSLLSEVYLSINTWTEKNNIPSEVFIKIAQQDLERNQNDNYKPQYVDFKSPVFILLIKNLIKKADDVIEISEMYPTSSDIKADDGYIKEFILNIS